MNGSLKILGLSALAGALAGVASAIFLTALAWATATRENNSALLYALPFAGLLIAWAYTTWGKNAARGNNLLLEAIHHADSDVPLRMAPFILVSTVVTHIFGGSAGREGTALQMGGAVAHRISSLAKLEFAGRRRLLMAGIAGGFGAVFGTPLAGAAFGIEVHTRRKLHVEALIPCLVASFTGDLVCRALGVHHMEYPVIGQMPISLKFGLIVVALGMASGLVSAFFSHAMHTLGRLGTTAWWRPFAGGLLVIGLTLAFGTQAYSGLSLPLISQSFSDPLPLAGFALKLILTVVTLAAGFKGGEVTPLFCIGALLGNAVGQVAYQPVAPLAAIGLVAVFAGAAKTPLACLLLGVELFGPALALPMAVACVLAVAVSGHHGIYTSQRRG